MSTSTTKCPRCGGALYVGTGHACSATAVIPQVFTYGKPTYEQLQSELTALRSERNAYKNALWKACGDDKEAVDAYLESVGFNGKEVK